MLYTKDYFSFPIFFLSGYVTDTGKINEGHIDIAANCIYEVNRNFAVLNDTKLCVCMHWLLFHIWSLQSPRPHQLELT